jgi:hypothetical protein
MRTRSANQTEYRKSLTLMDQWDDDWIWYAPNNDHPIITHNLSIIDQVLAQAQSFIHTHQYISIMYSHFSEFINLAHIGSPFWKLFGRDSTIIAEDDVSIVYTQAQGDNTGVQIVNKNLFRYWFDKHDLDNARIVRSEDVRNFALTKNQLIIVPKREIAAHFDGYSHTIKGLAEIAADQVPPLIIPAGFFDNQIKIKYGYPTYDPVYTNINPCARNYVFENHQSGTDIKTTLEHLPLFWKTRIAETIVNPALSKAEITLADARNSRVITNPYAVQHKKINVQTLSCLARYWRYESLPLVIAQVRKYKNGLWRKLSRVLKLHPTSSPYLSGDTFRSLATHIHDQDQSIAPTEIKTRDIVFVQSTRLTEFITKIHPLITAPYTLLTHNGDENIDERYLPFIASPTVIHWFAQNTRIKHPKVTPLPIGLENKWYYLHGIPRYFDQLRQAIVKKKLLILYKFNVKTNPTERTQALAVLEAEPLTTTFTNWRESFAYLRTLQAHAFVASPPGNGEDCIRTWEALYLHTVPIVKRSAMAEYFVSLDLPIVIIDDWSEIRKFTTTALETLYATMLPKFNNPALWAEFWKEKINHTL